MFASTSDADLFYERVGSGPPMLVMHGTGFDHQYVRRGLDPLADSVELIYYDHRGNGRSPTPLNWDAVTHESWAADADALRNRIGFEQVLLFGHCYGGYLAQEYALRYPERVAGLILCATAPAFDHAEAALANARSRGTPEQFELLLGGLTHPIPSTENFGDLFRAVLPLYFHSPDRSEDTAIFEGTVWSAAAFNHSFFRCLPHFSVVERLGEIGVPTLILSGDDDWIMPLNPAAERLHAGIPHSELVVFERCGHFPWAEAPVAFEAALQDWLARLG
jgi:proline iminopeptidase